MLKLIIGWLIIGFFAFHITWLVIYAVLTGKADTADQLARFHLIFNIGGLMIIICEVLLLTVFFWCV